MYSVVKPPGCLRPCDVRGVQKKENPVEKIRIAIVGVGNCASSLIQGLEYYRDKQSDDAIGLMHWEVGGYRPFDIEVVAAFDIDVRKVGKDVNEAIFEAPNCTIVAFCKDLPKAQACRSRWGGSWTVSPSHMERHPDSRTFLPSDAAGSDSRGGRSRS